jgi:hypothetical protein
MAIDADTQVVITMGQLLAGVGAVLVAGGGVLWAVLRFTIGSMRDDVRDIRNSIREMNVVNTRLAEQVALLRTDYAAVKTTNEYLAKWLSQFPSPPRSA